MSSFQTWLIGKKRFFQQFRAFSYRLPQNCRNLFFLPQPSIVNYSSYLSFFLSQNSNKDKTPSAPKVPLPRGTFSFQRNVHCGYAPPFAPACPRFAPRRRRLWRRATGDFLLRQARLGYGGQVGKASWRDRKEEAPSIVEKKLIWLWNIDGIPSHKKIELIRIANKYRPSIFLGSIFSPNNFSYDLAEKTDFYLIKKYDCSTVLDELGLKLSKITACGKEIPIFPKKFTLRERLALRILWRCRDRFTSLEEISSYVYGRRFNKYLHASEVLIHELRKKIARITGKKKVISNIRNYGYQMDLEAFKERKYKDL